MPKIAKTEEEWLKELGSDRFHILRQKGTERPFTGELLASKGPGKFLCAGCGAALFDAGTKFESGCGWPSFTAPLKGEAIDEHRDTTHGMVRTEVTCSNCGGHLGHVFPDGPAPTGLRYCINSLSLKKEKG